MLEQGIILSFTNKYNDLSEDKFILFLITYIKLANDKSPGHKYFFLSTCGIFVTDSFTNYRYSIWIFF